MTKTFLQFFLFTLLFHTAGLAESASPPDLGAAPTTSPNINVKSDAISTSSTVPTLVANEPATSAPEIWNTCNSFDVFQKTVSYLKDQKELPFSTQQIYNAALEINKGCNGADRRFRRVFEMLNKSGVETKKCYDLALDFSKMSDQKTDNFMVLFKGLFLESKFNLDFMTAFKVSLQLSAGLPGRWEKIRLDFEQFQKFCTDASKLDLPIAVCAQWTLNLIKQEEKFPLGIYESFEKINTFLTTNKGPQLNVRDRLVLITEVLNYGPTAPENFKKALLWMNTLNGDGIDPAKAHRFALQIAKNSLLMEKETATEKAARK